MAVGMRQVFGRVAVLGGVALLVCGVLVSLVEARPPQPDPVPTRWELEFDPDPVRFARVTDNEGNTGLYLYLTYDVTNFTGSDRLFAPSFDLMTDDGQIRRSGRGVPREVTDELIRRLENPLIEDQLQIVSTLLQGRENARTGIVAWPIQSPTLDDFSVFASGFSGESTTYFTTDRDTNELVRHVLRKTRALNYSVPGRVDGGLERPIEPISGAWVMR